MTVPHRRALALAALAALAPVVPARRASAQLRLSTAEVSIEFDRRLAAPIGSLPPAAYRGLYQLHVDGERYYLPTLDLSVDGPFLHFPEVALGGLRARREVYVPPEGGNWVRIVDILENPTAAPISARVEERGNLGALNYACVGSASGDAIFDAAELWGATKSPTYPLGVGHVVGGPGARVAPSGRYTAGEALVFGYDVVVPPGGRVALLLFSVPEPAAADVPATAAALLAAPEEALRGLDEVRDDVVNWDIDRPGVARLTLAGPSSVVEGDAATFELSVDDPDGSSVEVSWDLDADGVFGEAVGERSVTLPGETLDGPRLLPVEVEVVDAPWVIRARRVLTVVNVAPRFSAVVAEPASVGVPWTLPLPVRDAAGAQDPLTLELLLGPEGMALSAGALSFTPSAAQRTGGGPPHEVRVRARDDDDASTTLSFGLAVVQNQPPSAPLPAYPLDGATGLAGALRLVVANASDPDGDPLTYEFELDEDPTFASPSRVEAIAEGAGYTAAPFDGLAPSATYVWRARASDGEQAGPWAVAGFRTTAADAGLPDAGPGVSLPAPSCRAGHGPPGWLIPAALLALALWRRR